MVTHSKIADMQLRTVAHLDMYTCTCTMGTGEKRNALFWLFMGFTLTFEHCHSENELAMPQHRTRFPLYAPPI